MFNPTYALTILHITTLRRKDGEAVQFPSIDPCRTAGLQVFKNDAHRYVHSTNPSTILVRACCHTYQVIGIQHLGCTVFIYGFLMPPVSASLIYQLLQPEMVGLLLKCAQFGLAPFCTSC